MIQGRTARGLSRCVLLYLVGLVGFGITFAQGQGVAPTPAPPAASVPPSPLDQPLAWLLEARRNFTAVQDYTCTLTKRENVNGVLSDEHYIEAKFRSQPFSVYMRWLAPSKLYGQEAAFILGRNNNKMRVHSKGPLKGAVGFVSVDLNDRRVLEQSRHNIYEAGIGNLIEQAIKFVEVERQIGKAQVRTTEILTTSARACAWRLSAPSAARSPITTARSSTSTRKPSSPSAPKITTGLARAAPPKASSWNKSPSRTCAGTWGWVSGNSTNKMRSQETGVRSQEKSGATCLLSPVS